MMKVCMFFLFSFFLCQKASCFIDSFFKPLEKIADKALILESLSDLLHELQGDNSLEKELRLLSKDIASLSKEARGYKYLSKETLDLLNPSKSLHSLHQKVRYSVNYIRRVKNFKKRISQLGASSSAVTAIEQMKTNFVLNESLKNQYLLEIRKERERLSKEKRRLQLLKEEDEFLEKQIQSIRNHSKSGFGAFHPFKERRKK